ncbi:MAG: hypothetical protein K9G62_01200 [Alphaproteobacteria bacterium]|nr:hypothetical protein [Alphaproteobacteria bacterium]
MFGELLDLLKSKSTHTEVMGEIEENVVDSTFKNVGRKGASDSRNYYYNNEDEVFLERLPTNFNPRYHFTEIKNGTTHSFNSKKGDKVAYRQSTSLNSDVEYLKNNFDFD